MTARDEEAIRSREEVEPDQIRRRPPTGWRSFFANPRGIRGRLAGRLMGIKNAYLHDLLVEQIDPAPGDRILEIGFGTGSMIRKLSRRQPEAFVAGVDPSGVMISQASGRNRRAIRQGRVELRQAGVSKIPWPDGTFTVVCETNTLHNWPDPRTDLAEVRRVLRPSGRLLLGMRMRASTPGRLQAPGHDEDGVLRMVRLVEQAGFLDVRTLRRSLAREVVCILARR
jgi:SAM-dependent methyltransferase